MCCKNCRRSRILKGDEFFKKSTIAKFRPTTTSLMVETSNLANMTRTNLLHYKYKFDNVWWSIFNRRAFWMQKFVSFDFWEIFKFYWGCTLKTGNKVDFRPIIIIISGAALCVSFSMARSTWQEAANKLSRRYNILY